MLRVTSYITSSFGNEVSTAVFLFHCSFVSVHRLGTIRVALAFAFEYASDQVLAELLIQEHRRYRYRLSQIHHHHHHHHRHIPVYTSIHHHRHHRHSTITIFRSSLSFYYHHFSIIIVILIIHFITSTSSSS